jgi:hypothetical protein
LRPRRRGTALALLLLCAAPAWAWQPETRIRMVDEAVRLMPASLRTVLESHREPLLRGLLEPQMNEGRPEHRPTSIGGTLEAEIESRAQALVDAVQRPDRFREIAGHFGALAHFVTDAGFPPAVTADGASRYGHFAEFCESRRERFPVVFYGHDEPNLARNDYRAFAAAVMQQARREDADLQRAYRAAGSPPDPSHFGDRSVPFAVGSLSYSRAITNITRAWLSAWEQAYGDTGRTPYRKPAKADR